MIRLSIVGFWVVILTDGFVGVKAMACLQGRFSTGAVENDRKHNDLSKWDPWV